MLAKSEIKCPGCEFKNKVQFKKPGFGENAIVRTTCATCESDLLARFTRPKGKDKAPPGTLAVMVRIMKPSKLLIEMKKEEAEFKQPD